MTSSPFLTQLSLRDDREQPNAHPFTLPLRANGQSLVFVDGIRRLPWQRVALVASDDTDETG